MAFINNRFWHAHIPPLNHTIAKGEKNKMGNEKKYIFTIYMIKKKKKKRALYKIRRNKKVDRSE
jgi:hypothetical protein